MVSEQPLSASYAVVTAAYNEESHIGRLLASVVSQTIRPAKWIIVNDGSSDRTQEIILHFARQHGFIELFNIAGDHPRDLTAQVKAINRGFSQLINGPFQFIGNLDADVSFQPDYFERLLHKFLDDPRLGLGGGFIYEPHNGCFRPRSGNNVASVPHAVQLFRGECLQSIGGYKSFSWGGADWYAEVQIRMLGHAVRSFPDLPVYHHRPAGSGFGCIRYWFRGGTMDFYMGTHPIFEMFRLARRLRAKPYVIGAFVRLIAFLWATFRGPEREVPPDFMQFLRSEQINRLRAACSAFFDHQIGFRKPHGHKEHK